MILRTYKFNATDERAAVEEAYAELLGYIHQDEKSVQNCAAKVRVVEMPGSDHYFFLAAQPDVLREMRNFLAQLQPRAAIRARAASPCPQSSPGVDIRDT
jgi:hypothetical protein